jgi:hypothetical protein
MGKKKKTKKKKIENVTLAEKVRRENELKEYGRILSLRPSLVHKDKTKYNRKAKHKNDTSLHSDISD